MGGVVEDGIKLYFFFFGIALAPSVIDQGVGSQWLHVYKAVHMLDGLGLKSRGEPMPTTSKLGVCCEL